MDADGRGVQVLPEHGAQIRGRAAHVQTARGRHAHPPDLRTGEELYRQRLPLIGSGYSASPIAADDKIYLSNEDGEMLILAAGPKYAHIATNSMGELLMATPALSEGVMYVRSATSLFAIGRRR